ncbi:MAG: hypothetical protein RIC12_01985, partial [Pirellulales bacterium]
ASGQSTPFSPVHRACDRRFNLMILGNRVPMSAIFVVGTLSNGTGSGRVLSRGHVHAAPLFQ